MIEIIPIKERTENFQDTNKRFYIPNSNKYDNGIADKYNWAIENIILKSDDDVICFRHLDTEIRTEEDIVVHQVRKAFAEGAGVVGVIGTIQLENSCMWWTPNRNQNGAGYIIQGGNDFIRDDKGNILKDENGNDRIKRIEYPMADFPGYHDYLATVDGCCMWINKKLFQEGLRFDINLKGYHFYDTDICCQALQRGYKVACIPVVVKHDSEGKPPENMNDLRTVFFNKWNAKIDSWPISRYTKFH